MITLKKKKKPRRIKPKKKRQNCHVVCSGFEGNIKMNFGEMRRGVGWIYLPDFRIKR
jgi:hypothetical protein